ncbi:MAG TPA: uroporphyrinogen decarboxylase family protein [Clostridiales bacterium]|nr:uroporphyrinogen decarboxylase family protein [Clostridiales bacterium]HQK72164.1 uroporphyrinogen decarboxylase family protein [Clostridiales bacterium]
MSYADGMAAMNLEMPARVPRTEYSAEGHWALVAAVTGIEVGPFSPGDIKRRAQQAFYKAWNYDFLWSTLTGGGIFGDMKTSMGHAVYADGGVDFDAAVYCPFKSPEEVIAFDPWQVFGERDQKELTRQYEAHDCLNRAFFPDAVNMTGIYVTCMSGLIDLFGWEMLLLAAGTDPDAFGAMTGRYASWIQQYFDALAAADVPVVMVHDDIVWTSGAFIRPDWYRRYVFPNYKKFFAPLAASGKKIMFTSDGDYTQFIDDIAACGVNGFVLEPATDMRYIAEKYGKTHVFIGNADTRILLDGSRDDIYNEVKRCMDIGKNCPGYFMAVGNHIPANTPVENVLYYNEVYEKLSRR